ncbi:hypothetical protein BpV1_091c [Bathycoccus sp. RCC1105 virus BpV1]|uniref:hypothetical protein n=1 Tax=Bathycoccus sp. RCC1105 virus BpV1 TaxID=880159 RepID=UPI0001EF43DB|nr:hypothetical protein BpV1_091c [Bathycoccus sp. RCC1105 virus BpV1]ADQ91718.1 hypothetical protein BpV1_091c [Bathycoccus sp. RCC1105 virus BpV1]
MSDPLNILVEAKREYIGQLCLLMCPVMIETYETMYEEAYKLTKGRKVLVMYQKLLKEVPNWSDAMSKQHTDNITNRCAWFNDLLAAVFVSCVKILSAVRLNKDNKKISLKLPTNEVFVQTCYNNAAKDLYRDPYIYHETQNEHARNDKLYERFCTCIETTVKELIPVQQILQTYMSQTQEGQDLDLDEAEVGDSEDPDLIDGYEEETSEEPFDAEPPMEQSMEPPMEQSMEPPMEQTMEAPMEQVMQPEQERTSPFDNEFKTINTKQQQPYPQQSEEEGVLFPDASETRAKKVGYY